MNKKEIIEALKSLDMNDENIQKILFSHNYESSVFYNMVMSKCIKEYIDFLKYNGIQDLEIVVGNIKPIDTTLSELCDWLKTCENAQAYCNNALEQYNPTSIFDLLTYAQIDCVHDIYVMCLEIVDYLKNKNVYRR